MPIQLESYYNRFDPAKGYDAVLIRDGFAGQGAEINEIQSGIIHRIKTIADSLFRDGDIVRDGRISVNINNGETQCESGAIYLSGAVRGVPPATITVPLTGTVTVGVYLRERVITEQEDPSLYNPAVGSSAEGEPGAARLQTITAWGWQCGNTGDAQTGEFFPVYTLDDGNLRAKEAPPNLDAVTQALARYDRDSAGGTYVVSGLAVLQAQNTEDGRQVYTISEGRARVNGFPVELPTSRRLSYTAVPDLIHVDSEPHTATTSEGQRINLDRSPVATIQNIRITKQSTASLTHGSFTGAADPLPEGSVLEIVSVTQGGVAYTGGTGYKLSAGKVGTSDPVWTGRCRVLNPRQAAPIRLFSSTSKPCRPMHRMKPVWWCPTRCRVRSFRSAMPQNCRASTVWRSTNRENSSGLTASQRILAPARPTFPAPCCPSPECNKCGQPSAGSSTTVCVWCPCRTLRPSMGAWIRGRTFRLAR